MAQRKPAKGKRGLADYCQEAIAALEYRYHELRNTEIPRGMPVKNMSRSFELMDLIQKAHKSLTKLVQFAESVPADTGELFREPDA